MVNAWGLFKRIGQKKYDQLKDSVPDRNDGTGRQRPSARAENQRHGRDIGSGLHLGRK